MTCRITLRRPRGFSLIELMVALAIGSIILIAVLRIFIASRSTYQVDEGLMRLQENGRFALEFLGRDTRMAGYGGCLRDISTVYNNLNSSADFKFTAGIAVEGYEYNGTAVTETYGLASSFPAKNVSVNNWTPALPAELAAQAIPGSDVLVIRRASDDVARLVPPYNDSAQVFVEPGTVASASSAGDILMVTDCAKASLFQATTISSGGGTTNISHAASGTPGNQCANWGQPACAIIDPQTYGDGSQLMRYAPSFFHVGRGASGNPALMRPPIVNGVLDYSQAELVEGIENMQVLYGLDTDLADTTVNNLDGVNLRYMTAKEINDRSAAMGTENAWPRVVTVQIALLVRTVQTATSGGTGQEATETTVDTNSYALAGTIIDPVDDNFRRRVFTATLRLRNRGI